MAYEERDYVPHFGDDYDLARFSTGERDEAGHLIWHERLPMNDEWQHITMVTIDMDPHGEGMMRNFPINPDRPLDVYGTFDPDDPDSRYYYDLDDLVGDEMDRYGLEF